LRYRRGLDLAAADLFFQGGIHHFNVFIFLLFFVSISTFVFSFVLPYALQIGFGERRPD
jgi:hypothetical protein